MSVLGTLVRKEFRQLRRGAKVSDSQFRFVPPPGADVIGEAAAR